MIARFNGTTLFWILQRHYPQFLDVIKFQLSSRREFERLAATDQSTLPDLLLPAFSIFSA
ncbi:hypothetical protein EDC90_104812 [Martelella mediterranea]|uniref:Uncharacterized protein n=1 Tax=Martelella mediterranea TaxID=293089 RepID=A0A4R3NFT1_9HYPH|nr:hypothetical protein EDC90_104812 [Martelella mediterranea]